MPGNNEKGEEMRVLTVRQPWAWAIIHGGKDVENRVRNVAGNYRGSVAIHVAKAIAKTTYSQYLGLVNAGYDDNADQLHGSIIGVVDLVGVHEGGKIGCHPDATDPSQLVWCSPWAMPEHQHLEFANPHAIDPIPYTGALGLRRLPAEVVEQINSRLPRKAPDD